MPELAFLDAVAAYLSGPANLSPAPAAVGSVAPGPGDAMPVIVTHLRGLGRVELGLGGGMTEIATGALQVVSRIDLADPVLAGPEPLTLLDAPRTGLTLPHGGLIRADAQAGALSSDDLSVTVDGAPVTLVAGAPGAGEMQVAPLIGQVTFGTALPASGALVATYHLGIWERSSVTVTGTLIMDVWSDDPADLSGLTVAAARALGAPGGMAGLKSIRLTTVGAVDAFGGPPDPVPPQSRRCEFAFEYEHIVDRPMSSGGVIGAIPITTRTPGLTRDPVTRALQDTIAIETDD